MELVLKRCVADDLTLLCEFSKKTFNATYVGRMKPSTISVYMERAFSADKLRDELLNPDSSFFFLYADNDLTGYMKLNESPGQTDINDPASLEIERIYLAKEFQGRRFGDVLIGKAVEIATRIKKTYVWLSVWENNSKAIRFYKRNGFYQSGTHIFVMSDERQTDFIMRKDLRPFSCDSL